MFHSPSSISDLVTNLIGDCLHFCYPNWFPSLNNLVASEACTLGKNHGNLAQENAISKEFMLTRHLLAILSIFKSSKHAVGCKCSSIIITGIALTRAFYVGGFLFQVMLFTHTALYTVDTYIYIYISIFTHWLGTLCGPCYINKSKQAPRVKSAEV